MISCRPSRGMGLVKIAERYLAATAAAAAVTGTAALHEPYQTTVQLLNLQPKLQQPGTQSCCCCHLGDAWTPSCCHTRLAATSLPSTGKLVSCKLTCWPPCPSSARRLASPAAAPPRCHSCKPAAPTRCPPASPLTPAHHTPQLCTQRQGTPAARCAAA